MIEQRHEATTRELARVYLQLADAYDRLGEHELATMCRERAVGRQESAIFSRD
jgi:hypothetical protein